MELETDELALAKARTLIEEQLGWGDSQRWHTQDYELLSTRIHEKTGVQLSVATLKRLWGKIRYDSRPTPTTLNVLAQFLGFENWRSFRVSQESVRRVETPDDLRRNVLRAFVLLASVIVAGSAFLVVRGPVPRKVNPDLFSFSSRKVVDAGVPNTVVFDYDASAAQADDSIFIQQSWDERLSRQVERDRKQHTSIYYYPGFFEAKLRINQQVVKEHNLLITTSGWLPLIEQPGTPVYFKPQDAMGEGRLHLPVEKIESMNIPLQPEAPWVAYYRVGDFGGVMSDDVVFETRLRNDYPIGTNACQYAEIRVQFEGPAVIIPLASRGCVANISFGKADGTGHDFSGFGVDFSEWVDVRCTIAGDMGEIWVNGTTAVRFRLSGTKAKMVGIGYRFQGTGSVDHVRVSDSRHHIYYEEHFEVP